jgi:Ca2+-binding RTX toxin-like protein
LGVLEDRTVPTVSVSILGSTVTFTGDGAPDTLTLHRTSTGHLEYSANGSSFTPTLALAAITQVNVNLGGGNDIFTLDLSGGSVFPTSGVISYNGGDGTDTIAATGGNNYTLSGNSTSGTLTSGSPAGTVNLAGVEQASLTGSNGPDLMDCRQFSGPVTLLGGTQADTLYGGSGNDSINGGQGSDYIDGGAGDDILDSTNSGSAILFGGPGNDLLLGGNGKDSLDGEAGDDTLIGGNGADTLFGGAGNDRLEGQLGNDVIDGDGGRTPGPGFDTVVGTADTNFTVSDNPGDTAGTLTGLGTDTLINIE